MFNFIFSLMSFCVTLTSISLFHTPATHPFFYSTLVFAFLTPVCSVTHPSHVPKPIIAPQFSPPPSPALPPPVTYPCPCLVTPLHWWMVGVTGSAVEFKPAGSTDSPLPPPQPKPTPSFCLPLPPSAATTTSTTNTTTTTTFYYSCSLLPPGWKQCQKPKAGRSAEKTHNSPLSAHLPQHSLLTLSFLAGPSNRPGLLGPHKSVRGSGWAWSRASPPVEWAEAGHSLSLHRELSLYNDASRLSVNVCEPVRNSSAFVFWTLSQTQRHFAAFGRALH